MALLLQHRGEVALHRAELALRDADLVAALGRHDDARGIFRRLAERHHVGGQPVHRAHEQIEQREIDQRRGDRRDHQREQQDVAREADHRLAQRAFLDQDFDEVRARRPKPHHAHHVAVGAEEQRLQRLPHGAHRRGIAQVDVVMDRVRHVVDGEQLALVAHLDRDRLGAEIVENVLDHLVGQLELVLVGIVRIPRLVLVGVEHDRDGARDRDAVGQKRQAEIRDRGNIDQHFRQHHEQDREQQQLARQPEARRLRARAVVLWRRVGGHRQPCRHVIAHPNRRRKPIRRRTLGLFKLDEK